MRSLKRSSGTVRKVMSSVVSGLFACIGLAGAAAVAQSDSGAEAARPGEELHIRDAYYHALPQPSLKKMSAIDKLEAMEEIRLLPLRFARCITQRDADCLLGIFSPDSYYLDGKMRDRGPEGFVGLLRQVGEFDRVFTIVQMHGSEIEILSPTTARGISAANFSHFYLPLPGQPPAQAGTQSGAQAGLQTGFVPGQEDHTVSYYYQTFVKHDGKWLIKTTDHTSYDMRRELNNNIQIIEGRFSPGAPTK